MAVEEIGGKREEQERRNADDLSTSSESHLEDGASLPSLRQRRKIAKKKSNTPYENGKPGNRKKGGEKWNGYGNNEEWNTGMEQQKFRKEKQRNTQYEN